MAPASKDKGETAWEGFESSDDSSHASDTEIPKPALAAAPRKDRTLTSTSEPPQDAEGEPTVLYLGYGFLLCFVPTLLPLAPSPSDAARPALTPAAPAASRTASTSTRWPPTSRSSAR